MDLLTMINGYVRSELLILLPILYIIQRFLEKTHLRQTRIWLIICLLSIALCASYTFAAIQKNDWRDIFSTAFVSIVQGILIAAGSCQGINFLIIAVTGKMFNKRKNSNMAAAIASLITSAGKNITPDAADLNVNSASFTFSLCGAFRASFFAEIGTERSGLSRPAHFQDWTLNLMTASGMPLITLGPSSQDPRPTDKKNPASQWILTVCCSTDLDFVCKKQ